MQFKQILFILMILIKILNDFQVSLKSNNTQTLTKIFVKKVSNIIYKHLNKY